MSTEGAANDWFWIGDFHTRANVWYHLWTEQVVANDWF